MEVEAEAGEAGSGNKEVGEVEVVEEVKIYRALLASSVIKLGISVSRALSSFISAQDY